MRLLMIIWLVLLPFTLGTELKWGIVAITSVTAWTMLQVSEQRRHVMSKKQRALVAANAELKDEVELRYRVRINL